MSMCPVKQMGAMSASPPIVATRFARPDLAVILIEHDMGVIERAADRCVVLDYGRKIAEGDYATVTRDPAVRRAYLGEEAD